jgi:hypothetical protein
MKQRLLLALARHFFSAVRFFLKPEAQWLLFARGAQFLALFQAALDQSVLEAKPAGEWDLFQVCGTSAWARGPGHVQPAGARAGRGALGKMESCEQPAASGVGRMGHGRGGPLCGHHQSRHLPAPAGLGAAGECGVSAGSRSPGRQRAIGLRLLRVYENPAPNPRPDQPRLCGQNAYRRSKRSWYYYSP